MTRKPASPATRPASPAPRRRRDAPRPDAPARQPDAGSPPPPQDIGGIGSDLGPDLGPGLGGEFGRSYEARARRLPGPRPVRRGGGRAPVVAAARGVRVALAGMAVLVVAACASTTRIDTQWSDPEFAGRTLQGRRVLVACDASDVAIRRACQQRLEVEVTAQGASVVAGPEMAHPSPGRQAAATHLLPAAREARADAVLAASVVPDSFVVDPGPSVGIGVGGFGGGRVGWGGGVGVSVPIGEPQRRTGYAANATLTDTASGRLMWSAKASAPASRDADEQAGGLAKAVVESARKAGLF